MPLGADRETLRAKFREEFLAGEKALGRERARRPRMTKSEFEKLYIGVVRDAVMAMLFENNAAIERQLSEWHMAPPTIGASDRVPPDLDPSIPY